MPKIAYAQMKVSAGHPDINTKKILRLIDEARAGGADVVIFPELAISGLMLGDTGLAIPFVRDCEACSAKIMAASKNITVIFGSIMESRSDRFKVIEAAANRNWIDDPVAINFARFYEQSRSIPVRGVPTPFNLTLRRKKYRGAYIFDARENFVNSRLDFCIRFSSEPFSIDKKNPKDKINCPIICVGCVGIQNTGKTIYTFDGGSAVFNSRGEVVQRAEPFTECLNFIELDEIDKMPALEVPEISETEKIYRTISYGVKNFLGIDSAVAAALYTQVVGAENVYLVNMPSVFNSATTKNLSEQLAKNLGCKYYVVPIQESVDWTVKQLEERGIKVSNFVKENIQARDRSSRILAAIAASVGGVFTCNANKAESTVGYATLYGDAAGFLSALADLWKYQIYDLARYMNEKIYGREVIPQGIIDIVPSAELSTAQNVDEGKGDPLKYPYHDYLFRAFAEYNLTPESILRCYRDDLLEKEIGCEIGLVEKYFPTAQEFIDDLERWWKQFTGMGVAKRIQSPPILAVTNLPYGERRESQNGWHFTRNYLELKNKLLAR